MASINARRPISPSPPFQSAGTWLTWVLTLAASIALWQMHRSAFFLFAARFALAVVAFALVFSIALYRNISGLPQPITDSTMLKNASSVAITALLAWYAYKITPPKSQTSEDTSTA